MTQLKFIDDIFENPGMKWVENNSDLHFSQRYVDDPGPIILRDLDDCARHRRHRARAASDLRPLGLVGPR